MRKFTLFFLLLPLLCFSQTKISRTGVSHATLFQRVIDSKDSLSETWLCLVVHGDTSFLKWDGSTLNIISDTLLFNGNSLKGTYPEFSSVAELRLSSSPENFINLTGYYAPGDGGGGIYFWSASDTSPDNNGSIIKLNSVPTGRFLLAWHPSQIYAFEAFGGIAKGPVSKDTVNSRILKDMQKLGYITLFGPHTYRLGICNLQGLEVKIIGTASKGVDGGATVLYYRGNPDSIFFKLGGSSFDTFTQNSSQQGINIQGIRFVGAAGSKYGVVIRGMYRGYFADVTSTIFDNPWDIRYFWTSTFINPEATKFAGTGLRIMDTATNGNVFINTHLSGGDTSAILLKISGSHSTAFYGLTLEGLRQRTIDVDVWKLTSLTISNLHVEGEGGHFLYLNESQGSGMPTGIINITGGVASFINVFPLPGGTYDSTKFIAYSSGARNSILKSLRINGVALNLAKNKPWKYASDFFDLSGVLQADISPGFFNMVEDTLFDYPSFVNLGDSVPAAYQPYSFYNVPKTASGYVKNRVPYVTTADTTRWGTGATSNIDDGTTVGQMPYWSGSKWKSATGLKWDSLNYRLGINISSNPNASVEIRGTSGAATGYGILRFDTDAGSNNSGIKIGALAGASSYSFVQSVKTGISNNNTLLLNPAGGDIGIATTSPSVKLDVAGDAAMFYITADSAITLTPRSSAPPSPVNGMLYIDSSDSSLRMYYGSWFIFTKN